jgi:hypothetical protein
MVVSLSPRCLSSPLAMRVKSLFESKIYAFSLEISCHVPPSYFRRRFSIRSSQAVVASLFFDRRVACTHRGTSFSNRRVRATLRYSGLVCGSWWWFVVVGCCWGLETWCVPWTRRLRRWPALFQQGKWMSFFCLDLYILVLLQCIFAMSWYYMGF